MMTDDDEGCDAYEVVDSDDDHIFVYPFHSLSLFQTFFQLLSVI
jgi:hypothetical protein